MLEQQPSCERRCGGTESSSLPEDIRQKVQNHPCYNEEAHNFYARMHIPVAPKCNIQCNFCDRRYDCSNESRPGVTSKVLTPEQAANKVGVVAGSVSALSVVGIAGPGDPLANEKRTFRALELIKARYPDLKLCLSTNGLMLPDYVDRLQALDIDHVTITINAIDPDIGAAIYAWVVYRKKQYEGAEGAKILRDRQLEGLAMLTERGILCKVNSVMLPGVNDEHLPEVAKKVNDLGAFLHNIIPFIPSTGSVFGDAGMKGPRAAALRDLQDRCGGDIQVMRHCRQCRADAVGLLQTDRSAEFDEIYNEDEVTYDQHARQQAQAAIEVRRNEWREAKERMIAGGEARVGSAEPKMLIAVATKGDGVVNQHFGHAQEFSIYEASGAGLNFIGARNIGRNYCDGPATCGDNEPVLPKVTELLSDCAVILSARFGQYPRQVLEDAGFKCVESNDLIVDAIGELLGDGSFRQRKADWSSAPEPVKAEISDLQKASNLDSFSNC